MTGIVSIVASVMQNDNGNATGKSCTGSSAHWLVAFFAGALLLHGGVSASTQFGLSRHL